MNLRAVAEKEAIYLDQAEVYTHIAQTYDPNGIGLHYPSMYQDLIKKIIVSQKLITLMVLFGAKDKKIQGSNTFLCHVDTACSRKKKNY